MTSREFFDILKTDWFFTNTIKEGGSGRGREEKDETIQSRHYRRDGYGRTAFRHVIKGSSLVPGYRVGGFRTQRRKDI